MSIVEGMSEHRGDGVLIACTTYGRLPAYSPLEEQWTGILFDEVHCMPTATRVEGCFCTPSIYYIGLSATPLQRQDDKNGVTVSLCGPVVYEVSISTLEEEGFLAKGQITRIIV
jgi:superfamily II DNA or RNA helicase